MDFYSVLVFNKTLKKGYFRGESDTIGAVSWYWRNLVEAIIKNNYQSNKCGIITDINKFTLGFSVWPQK